MAGAPLDIQKKRAHVVSPMRQTTRKIIAPLDGGFGDFDTEKRENDKNVADSNDEWERLSNKYEELGAKVMEYIR